MSQISSTDLNSNCLVATGWLKMFTPALLSVPKMAPFLTRARHTSPDPCNVMACRQPDTRPRVP